MHCPLLSSFKKELEADSQFDDEGYEHAIVVAFFVLQVIVFNAGNHVLSERNVAADHIALEAFVAKCIISTVHGVSNGGYSGLIIVFAIEPQLPASLFFAPAQPMLTTKPSSS